MSGKYSMRKCTKSHDNHMNTKCMGSAVGKKESCSFLEACNWSSAKKIFSDDGGLVPSNGSSCIDGWCVNSENSNILAGCSSNESKPTIFHGKRDSSNQCEKHDLLDSSLDDLSCSVRSDNVNMVVDNSCLNNERKNASSDSFSVNNFLFTEKTVDEQLNEHCDVSRHSEKLQSKKKISDFPSLAALPDQSDLSEISSFRNFFVKGEVSVCSEGKEGSSFDKMMNNMEVAVTAIHSVPKEHKEKSHTMHDGPSREELSLPARATGKENVSDASNDEVRACDICGDVGWENMLAVCSKCSDGAEHIYCTWMKMDKVPDGDWMCEECAVEEKAKKKMKNIVGRAEKCQRESSWKTNTKKDKGLGDPVKTSGLGIQKRKINNVSMPPDKSRPIQVEKRKFESSAKPSEFPSSSHKKLIRQHISIKDVDEGKSKHHQVTCTNLVSLNSSSKGFMRSKTFHVRDKNVNEDRPLNPKSDIETNEHKKEANGRKICKLGTFNATSYRSCTDDYGVKRIPTSSHVKGRSNMEEEKHHRVLGDVRQPFGNSKEEKPATKSSNLKFAFGFRMPIPHATFHSPKLVVPQPDFSWKGELEVVRIGGVSSSFSGFQAHLSNSASLEVHDVVKRFPQKLLLNEVSRSSTWPAQFSEKNAMEQDIALFFFAEDLESYERNCRILSDTMVKEDLALKGCIDGVEMLIFLSDLLPEGSQRWNGLSYLWCVIRNLTFNTYDDKPYSPCNIPKHATKTHLPAHPMNEDEYSPGESSAPRTSCNEEQNSNSSSSKTSLHASFRRSNIPLASSYEEKVSSPQNVINRDSTMISACVSTKLFNGSFCETNFLVDGKDSNQSSIWELKQHSPATKGNHDCGANKNLCSGMDVSQSFVDAKHHDGTSINVSPGFSKFGRDVETMDYRKTDHKDWFAPKALDLELSLGCGKKSGRGLALTLREEMVKECGRDKHYDSMTNDDEVSTALVLTLAPPLAR